MTVLAPVLLRRPSDSPRLRTLLGRAAAAALTYPEVCASGDVRLPSGYRHLEETAVVGRGATAWERAGAGLWAWDLHRGAGMTVASDGPAGAVGSTVVAAAPLGPRRSPLAVAVACRVVAVVDEPRRRGFAYGTLPGHPVSGEELFTVEHGDDDLVRFRLVSFSRPVGLPAAAPALVRAGQRLANRRFVASATTLAG